MKDSTGFTLIETMIAVTILTLAIAGPMFTASRAIVAAYSARDQLTASYLAQEGVEYVRALRDNEYLAAYRTWDGTSSLSGAFSTFVNAISTTCANYCTLDLSNAVSPLASGNVPLYLASNGEIKYYTINPNANGIVSATSFTRTIQVTSDGKIISKVSWSFHSTPYSVTIIDHLTSWQ